MTAELIHRRDMDFILYDVLGIESLLTRPRFADHDRDTLSAVMDTAYAIADAEFAPHNRKADEAEPEFRDGKVEMVAEVGQALRHYIDAGFMTATADYEIGGMQLPFTLHQACSAVFGAANTSTRAYPLLTQAAANVIRTFGTEDQRSRYMRPMREGRFFGTMCLTEPQAGSSLGDLRTSARQDADGSWRITGNKIFISAGDHELSENIIHLVLARIAGAPPGVKGISLFIVPKVLVNDDGTLGARNDVALAGLIHKMGYRGTTSTMLNFGEQGGAVGYLVGEPDKGLSYMFHMMNEARIGVGTGAAALGYAGYRQALAYARERLQGRPLECRDPTTPPVPLTAHPDIRRMLLAQKAYVEGGLTLCLLAATLVDERDTAPEGSEERRDAHELLELLTPVVKSWPSQWCLEANALAIQVFGGYGYTREYPVEQLYRDNRLNPIHEGAHGIQALDLLGRKVRQGGGRGFALLRARMRATIAAAAAVPALAEGAAELEAMLSRLEAVTVTLLAAVAADANKGLANASIYLEAFGHGVVAWIWLRQALVASARLTGGGAGPGDEERAFLEGKLHACAYFLRWELPRTGPQLDRLEALDDTWLAVPPECL